MMTKKDFKQLAEILGRAKKKELGGEIKFQDLEEDLINFCKSQNSLFNENRFKQAIEQEVKK